MTLLEHRQDVSSLVVCHKTQVQGISHVDHLLGCCHIQCRSALELQLAVTSDAGCCSQKTSRCKERTQTVKFSVMAGWFSSDGQHRLAVHKASFFACDWTAHGYSK
ncbi:hypothetical protein E2C01_055740 [Portunus trituberculatus]|uniref:Uncharacterized protein n=1 Tax=Portunus trituberculatus TaxID=210409 RepID=A0A5B7GWD0_PORTR|nr:hypothetical protein [Portunus trituberculatus]